VVRSQSSNLGEDELELALDFRYFDCDFHLESLALQVQYQEQVEEAAQDQSTVEVVKRE
jgi:hypothetical protein